MANEALQLAVLLTLKDSASTGLDRFASRLKVAGKEGQTFANQYARLQESLQRDLVIGGVGVAGLFSSLALMKKGVDVAGTFQAAMTELRTTFTEVGKDGKVNMDFLGKEMLKAEALTVKLGNKLPGTTQDFVEMTKVLKQQGLASEDIFSGLGEAVAYLAVATKSAPADLAKNFAQFAQMFELSGNDAKKAADTFSRLYVTSGIKSDELIEGMKYFQGRAGSAMGLTGLEKAQEITQILGIMKRHGHEGSAAGTYLTDMISEYNTSKAKGKFDELKKATGIEIEWFKDGKFAGWDTVFRQLQQFQKLTDEVRSTKFEELFGRRGMTAATVFSKTGADGWESAKDRLKQAIDLDSNINAVSANYVNQIESLTGSLENLVVAGFEPLLPAFSRTAEAANEVVGNLTDFARANPGLVTTLATLTLYGTTAMTVYSAFKTLTTGVRMFRIASAFTRGDSLLPYLRQTAQAANTASSSWTTMSATMTREMNGVQRQARTFKDSLRSFTGSQNFKIGVQIASIAGLEYLITRLVGGMLSSASAEAADKATRQDAAESFRAKALAHSMVPRMSGPMNDPNTRLVRPGPYALAKPQDAVTEGRSIFNELNKRDNELVAALRGERLDQQIGGFFNRNPWRSLVDPLTPALHAWDNYAKAVGAYRYQDITGTRDTPIDWMWGRKNNRVGNNFTDVNGQLDIDRLAGYLRKEDSIRDPSGMVGLLYHSRRNLPSDQSSKFEQAAQKAFPESYNQALQILPELSRLLQSEGQKSSAASQSFIESLSSLQQPLAGTAELFSGLPQPMTETAGAFQNLMGPTNEAAGAFDRMVPPAGKLPSAFNNIFSSAGRASISLDLLGSKISNWQMPSPQISSPTGSPAGMTPTGVPSIFTPPGYAVGGTITRSGLAIVHANEEIVPARAVAYRKSAERSQAQTVTINAPLNVTVNGDSGTAAIDFRRELTNHAKHIERIVARAAANGRARA